MKRVVHVAQAFEAGVFDFLVDLVGGISDYEHTIIYAAGERTPKGFRSLFPAHTRFVEWRAAGRQIRPIGDLRALIELVGILAHMGSWDVLHLHSSKAGFLGRLAARLLHRHRRVLYSPHGVSLLRQDVSRTTRRLFALAESLGALMAGKVVACSQGEARALAEAGIPCECVPNGIRCDDRPVQRVERARREVTIGTVGRITAAKNPALFGEIAEAVARDRARFTWIGDGEAARYSLGPGSAVEVTGWLEAARFSRALADLDIYLSTSSWEGLPLSGLRAMCACLPLVMSDCPGNRELVVHARNGFIFRSKEEAVRFLELLMSDRGMRISMGEASRDLVCDRFRASDTHSAFRRLYEEAASS
jgi:glycosyltransferase involved in cell wall biosynthesis